MATLKKICMVVVYVFAAFGASVILLGLLSAVCRPVERTVYREAPHGKIIRVEVKSPQLNWQAADRALARWLDGIAPLTQPVFSGGLPSWRQEDKRSFHAIEWERQMRKQPPPPQPVVICR